MAKIPHIQEYTTSTLFTTGVCEVNIAGQIFLVGNLACTDATLWISMQIRWYSSRGEVTLIPAASLKKKFYFYNYSRNLCRVSKPYCGV